MSGLPPPAGRPVTMFPRPDPWLEQARRDAEHRDAKRRRRRRWMLPVGIAILLAIAVGAVALTLNAWPNDANPDAGNGSDPVPSGPVDSAPAKVPTPVTVTSTIPPERLVRIDEVWLVDRGEGVYDWGVTVQTVSPDSTRSGVDIEVRLLDETGDVVKVANGVIDGVDTKSLGGVAGQLVDPDTVPIRIEFDVSVGTASDDASWDDLLDVRALERDGKEIGGRIRSQSPVEVTDVVMLLVWRDEAGRVIATVPEEIERLRSGIDARFVIDVNDERVPDRRPDSIIWVS